MLQSPSRYLHCAQVAYYCRMYAVDMVSLFHHQAHVQSAAICSLLAQQLSQSTQHSTLLDSSHIHRCVHAGHCDEKPVAKV